MITRGFANVITSDVPATKNWYMRLLEWQVAFDSDWFVHLTAPGAQGVELGIIDAAHEIVADLVAPGAGGVLLTFVVDNVDITFRRATDLGFDVVEAPTDLFYGQRRMIVRDPNGTMVDISSASAQPPDDPNSTGAP